jgi:hypothetical protein
MNTPAALARAKVTPDRQWVIFQGSDPAFAAEMNRISANPAVHMPAAD